MFGTSGRRVALGLAAMVAAAGLAGCSTDTPAWRKARQAREQALDRSVAIAGSIENRRSEKLAGTLALLRDRCRRDQAKLNEDLRILRHLPANEVKEWNQREPAYRQAIQHHLQGDPATIETTVPYLVY